MQLWVVIVISVGLAMDAFAVSIATATRLQPLTYRHIFRNAFHFGLFQALMPILGWLCGYSVADKIAAVDHWIAFGLLAFVGGKSIHGALADAPDQAVRSDPTRGLTLVANSVATSIDAFAVGFSFACLAVSVWYPALIIGVITAALSALGMAVGSWLGARFGKKMEIAGGLVLIGIGVKILLEHILA